MEKEAPGILNGIKMISKLDLPKGEHRLHALARLWEMTVPLRIHMYNCRNVCQPMVDLTCWFEFLIHRKPEILLGGFPLTSRYTSVFLESF